MMRSTGTRRQGAAIVYAMAVIAVIAILTADVAQNIMAGRRLLESRHNRLQSLWLARSGFEVSVAKLLSNPEYRGEESELIADGRIRLTLEKLPQATDTYRVKCTGLFPANERLVSRHEAERVIRRIKDGDAIRIEVQTPKAP